MQRGNAGTVFLILLAKLGRLDEVRAEFERAAILTRNTSEREPLLEHAAACGHGSAAP